MEVGLSFVVLVLQSLAAAALLLCVLYLASALTEAIVPRPQGAAALRLAATGIAGLWILGVAFHVLLALHAFTLGAGLILFGALAAATAAWRRPRSVVDAFPAARGLRRWWRRGYWRRPWISVAAAALGIMAVRVLFVPPVAWDTLTYHLVKAALWVRDAGPIRFEAPGGGGMYMGVPGGVESLWAWVMLPFHSDLLVGVADVAGTALLGLGVYAMARELGVRARHGLLAAAFVLSMPSVMLAAGSNYVDNLNTYFLSAGTAFCLRFLRRREPGWALLAGMAFGCAAAAKLTGIPMLGIALAALAIAWATARAPRRGLPLSTVAAAAALAGAVAAPWYLQNWIRLGHPFSPYPVRIGGWVLGASPDFEWYSRQYHARPRTLADELTALTRMIYSPFKNTLGALAALPLLMLPVALWRYWKGKGPGAFFVIALLAWSFAAYWDPQFLVVRLAWSEMNGRHFLLAVALAVSLGFRVSPGSPYTLILALGIALNVWTHGGLFWTPLEHKLVVSFSVLAVALAWGCSRLPSARLRAGGMVASAFVCLGVAGVARDSFRATLANTATITHPITRYPEEALEAIDGRGIRVAFTSGPYQIGDNWLVYPFLGSRLQNEPVYVPISRSGRLVSHTDPAYLKDVDRDAWLARLETQDVDAVMAFPPASPELAWMEAAPERFRRISGEMSRWGLFERLR